MRFVCRIHLANFVIAFSPIDIFGYQLGSTEQHTLEIGILIIEFTKPEIFCGNNNPFIFRPVTDYPTTERDLSL